MESAHSSLVSAGQSSKEATKKLKTAVEEASGSCKVEAGSTGSAAAPLSQG